MISRESMEGENRLSLINESTFEVKRISALKIKELVLLELRWHHGEIRPL